MLCRTAHANIILHTSCGFIRICKKYLHYLRATFFAYNFYFQLRLLKKRHLLCIHLPLNKEQEAFFSGFQTPFHTKESTERDDRRSHCPREEKLFQSDNFHPLPCTSLSVKLVSAFTTLYVHISQI